MKGFLPIIILSGCLILAALLLGFVVKMIWFPPGQMGLIMGMHSIYNHLFFLLNLIFWIVLFFIGITLFIWIFPLKKKRNKLK